MAAGAWKSGSMSAHVHVHFKTVEIPRRLAFTLMKVRFALLRAQTRVSENRI